MQGTKETPKTVSLGANIEKIANIENVLSNHSTQNSYSTVTEQAIQIFSQVLYNMLYYVKRTTHFGFEQIRLSKT